MMLQRLPAGLGQHGRAQQEHPRDPRGAQDHAPPNPRQPDLPRHPALRDLLPVRARQRGHAAPRPRPASRPQPQPGVRDQPRRTGPRQARPGRGVLQPEPGSTRRGAAALRRSACHADQRPRGLRGRLPHPGAAGTPTPLRRSLLPQTPGLREFQQALHGRVRQQRHGVRGDLRAAGRRLRLHRMPEVRGAAHPLPGPLP